MVLEKKRKARLDSIDILRGYSIFLMLFAHVETYWLEPNSLWLIALKFLILNPGGTSQFNYIAGVGFGLSWAAAEAKKNSQREIFWQSMSRTIIMIIISFGYNLAASPFRDSGWAGLWSWNILHCIAFSRFFGTFFMQYAPKIRFSIALILVAVGGAVTYWMVPRYTQEGEIAAQVVFYLLYNPIHGDGLLVFFPFFLVGSIVGEQLQRLLAMENADSTQKIDANMPLPASTETIKVWLIIGCVLFFGAMLLGMRHEGAWMDFYNLMQWANTHPKIEWTTLPLFLLPNSYAWSLYCMGFHLLLTSIFVYCIDLRHRSSKPWRMLFIYGRYSISIYFFHYILLIIPPAINPDFYVTYISVWFPLLLFYLIFWGICEFLEWAWHGKASVEYAINILSNLIYDAIIKTPGKKTAK